MLFFKTSANIRWKKISHTWRTPTYEQQKFLRSSIISSGLNATPVIDRFYFHSVYFREPGRILFEIATNRPGFTTDEKVEELGSKLMLPPWLEPEHKDLEKILPQLHLPKPRGKSAKTKTQFADEDK
ncbi:MAG TPA: hypothetical protein VE223_05270 [Nitrososphaeraceae archaeon]|nr:hypothetical protein [Nitrososphaeraceae archaeon]